MANVVVFRCESEHSGSSGVGRRDIPHNNNILLYFSLFKSLLTFLFFFFFLFFMVFILYSYYISLIS